MRAGAAKVDITPRVGVDLTGYANRENPSRGVHDRLYAKALVLEEDEKFAVVTLDLIGISRGMVRAVRREVSRETGIKGKNILIAASHTHSGPATIFLHSCGKMDRGYISLLRQKLVQVILKASRTMTPAKIGTGSGRASIGVNRRLKVRHGISMAANPSGPVDTQVGVVYVTGRTGKPLATLVNYACHAVVLGRDNLLISADYPGAMQRFVEKKIGGLCLFTNGACGDINPKQRGGFGDVERTGAAVGREVLKIVSKIKPRSGVGFRCGRRVIDLPLKPPMSLKKIERELVRIRKRLKAHGLKSDFELDWAGATKRVVLAGSLRTIKMELQAMIMGDTVLVATPGEVFVEIGLKIKKLSPFKHTFFIGYADGLVGYIPTRKAFREGGYEVEIAPKLYGTSFLSPAVEELIEKNVLSLLRSEQSNKKSHLFGLPKSF